MRSRVACGRSTANHRRRISVGSSETGVLHVITSGPSASRAPLIIQAAT